MGLFLGIDNNPNANQPFLDGDINKELHDLAMIGLSDNIILGCKIMGVMC